MSNLIKPYEISIWESTLVPKGEESEDRYFQEKKIAVIGSSTMTSPCKVYDPVLHKNKNGEKTLSFSIKSRYYDVDKQDFAENPFYPYLINERKVKLYYDDEWYEFIIKECNKSSEEYEWHYECQDAFVLELSKTGYSITFNSELGNNQGSATQLAAIALENTDWQIVNIDIDPPKVNEPIYMAVLSRPDLLTIKNMDDDSDAQDLNSDIFVFYSYVSNGNGENVQFIEQAEHYDVDSNNNITATNYRIVDKLTFKEDGFYKVVKGEEGQADIEVKVIALGQLYLDYQAYRILFQQLSTYDPVMERTVDRYEAKDLSIYHYADYVYTSSNVVTSFVANGSDFKTYDSKKADYLQGWTRYTGAQNNPELSVTTFPEDMHSDLIPLESLKQAEGYIETKFAVSQNPSRLTQEGYLFNSGIENNAGMIGNIQKGEKFLFRWRAVRADFGYNKSKNESVYSATLKVDNLSIINTDTGGSSEVQATEILVFSSCLNNNKDRQAQFIILKPESEYDIDDKGNITDTNYIVTNELKYIEDKVDTNRTGFYKTIDGIDVQVIQVKALYVAHQVYKIVAVSNRQLTELEPNHLGAVVGYYNKIDGNNTYRSYNELDTSKILLHFRPEQGKEAKILNNKLTSGHFTVAENAPEGTKSFYIVDGVVQEPSTRYIYQEDIGGEEYVWDRTLKLYRRRENRGYFKYDQAEPTRKISYVIEEEGREVPVDPEAYTIYVDIWTKESCIWDGDSSFIEDSDETFFDYYYLTAEATAAVTTEALRDSNTHIGIFFYINNGEDVASHYYYFQDLQLTRYYEDANGNPVVLGQAPTAKTTITDYFYVAPELGTQKESVDTYASLAALAERLGIPESDITPVYTSDDIVFWTKDTENEEGPFLVKSDVELGARDIFYVKGYVLSKILSIEASKSNIFNILQTIAETFECWLDIEVFHNADGSIELDESKKPLKFIYLRRYAGKDNFAGFKYGINLKSVERIVDSNEVVTKLLVDDSQSDLVDSGFISIQKAESNISKEGYILNFDYFFNMKLLDRETVEKDYLALMEDLRELNIELNELEARKENLEGTLNKLSSNRNVYVNYLDSAKDALNRALDDFKRQSGGYEYEEYEGLPQPEKDKILALLDNDTFMNTIGTIYNSAIVINNYAGLSGVNNEEYEEAVGDLYGQKDGHFTVTRVEDSTIGKHLIRLILDDYIVPFKFKIDEEEYSTSINQKNFEIQVEEGAIVTLTDFVYGDKYEGILNSQGEIVEEITPLEFITQNFTLKIKEEKPSLQDEIDELIEAKKKRIALFENKYSQYILEGNWSSNEYISDELYYLDALNLSRVSAFPKITYNISVVDISGIDEYSLYSFDTGDRTYIEDTEFFGWDTQKTPLSPAREEVIVSEIEWHLDDPSSNSITVQNYKTNFEDLFQRIQATVQTVQYNETTYPKTSSFIGEDGSLNESVLLDSLNKISGRKYNLTTDGSVYIDGNTILIKNLTNATNYVKINSEGIQITSDGGTTWSTAVSGQGINIGKVFAGSINTKEIFIGNPDNASFFWDSNGINAYQFNAETEKYDHNTYVRFDEYGLYGIKNGTNLKLTSLKEVKDNAHFGLTWDGFFIKNTYDDGGYVSISSDRDIEIIDGSEQQRVHIGLLGKDSSNHNIYGLVLKNAAGQDVIVTDSQGNITLTGTIQSSDYNQYGGLTGWQITREGDATFNNVSVRGAIKTAVFEYSEIQAVGGISIFRPSSTIRGAEVVGDDLKITTEKAYLFAVDDWVKVSNYNTTTIDPRSDISTTGLNYIYRVKEVKQTDARILTLENGAEMIDENLSVAQLIGGALIGMGHYENGATSKNYGIGINSSDNAVYLPQRAISLFETIIQPNQSTKVNYNLRGILGTLPSSQDMSGLVDNEVYRYMQETQGIYTDNMYIGDANQYLAFYTKNNEKRLDVKGGIHALSLTIGEGGSAYDGAAAINANGYTIEIISDPNAAPQGTIIDLDTQTYIYPVLYHNGEKAEEYILTEDEVVDLNKTYYTRSGSGTSSDPYVYTKVTNPTGNPKEQGWYQKRMFVWYENNSSSGIVGDELHGGIVALYGKSYRVTYTFDDTEVGDAPTTQQVLVDPSKYITKISDTGIRVHPEDTSGNNYIQIADNIDIYRNNVSVAQYGAITRIGIDESSRFLIKSASLEAYDENNSNYFKVDSSGIHWRGHTAATTDNINTAIHEYITDINEGGILVHDKNIIDNYVQINSDGLDVIKNNISVAKFGTISRLGKEYDILSENNESYIELDYHSLKMMDLENSLYFYISDLRKANGEATIVDEYIYKENPLVIYDNEFNLSLTALYLDYSVIIDEIEVPEQYISKTATKFRISRDYLLEDAKITATYITNSNYAKAYTNGIRATSDSTDIRTGAMSFAEGVNNIAGGFCSHVGGEESRADGKYSFAYGKNAKALNLNSIAFGKDVEASGEYSLAIGKNCNASGKLSYALGAGCEADGSGTYALGDSCVATASNTFAFGQGCEATSDCCVAIGNNAHAGVGSEGGECALAIGQDVVAHGTYSIALNKGTKVIRECQTVLGRYNVIDEYHDPEAVSWSSSNFDGKYIVIVGKGHSNEARSNAFTIDWSGNIQYAGSSSQMSDRRLKEHIAYLNETEKANQFIRSLKPVHFKKDKKDHLGFYAQDIEKIDQWHCMTDEMNGFKTLGYTEIIAPLVAYCQHLEKRIEELEGGGN